MLPALSAEMMASFADSVMARKRSSLVRKAATACWRSPISRCKAALARRRARALRPQPRELVEEIAQQDDGHQIQ